MAADSRELISSLESQWRDALCAKDLNRLRTLIHREFKLIGMRSTGPFTLSRDEWLEAIQKRELIRIDLEVTDAVALEGVLVGTVAATWCVDYRGRPVEDCVLLTDVWVYDDGRWQVVRRHSSPMPTEESSLQRADRT